MIAIATRLKAQANMQRERWLGDCVGFRVDGPDGSLGVVEGVRGDAGDDRSLVVRGGGVGRRRRLEVPAAEVVDIIAARRRVLVAYSASRSRAVNVLPSPGVLSASIVPPRAETSSRAIASPSPAPPESRFRATSAR
jgi:hypothetical protein